MKKNRKLWNAVLLCSCTLLLSACGTEKEVAPTAQEQQYAANVKNTPKISTDVSALIKESIGEPTEEQWAQAKATAAETGEEVKYPQPLGTFNPGEAYASYYGSMTQKELLAQDKLVQINIFINGVVRDEYAVAANTLYGPETVKTFKAQLREAMLVQTGETGETTYVDRIGTNSPLNNGEVVNAYVDDVITYFNKSYIQTELNSNFGDKLTVTGKAYGLDMYLKMNELYNQSSNFVVIKSVYTPTEEEKAALTQFYKDSFLSMLEQVDYEAVPRTGDLGGFEKTESGTWIPVSMEKLAAALLLLVYGF